jgi:hypothetical protein
MAFSVSLNRFTRNRIRSLKLDTRDNTDTFWRKTT